MAEEKSKRRQEMFYSPKNGYDLIDDAEKILAEDYSSEYIGYLDACRTEREAVRHSIALARERGFVPYERGMKLTEGMRIYKSNRGKALMLAVIGSRPLGEGVNIAAAHVDSPRIDLKQLPLYEDSELAYFKTHYYGGIKKYQWTAIPLELHGVVALKDGSVVDVVIGRDKSDPQFVITDLLPHLAAEQMKKSLNDAFTGEGLNVLVGSIPDAEKGEDRTKLAVMSLLNEKYGVIEADFISAELSVVPSFETRQLGVDRSLIGGYGQDDRSCAFAQLKALFDVKNPSRTAVCILADKEEIGSEGVSGMKSAAFERFMGGLCESQGVELGHCFENSLCISADVCSGFDPNYPDVSEKRNNAKLNYGLALMKYTGSRGKSGASDAAAEIIGNLRRVFDDNKVLWQMTELGKVDQGGGGTVAMFMAQRNIDTIDAGIPLLSMHAPYEVSAKLDCYMCYKGIRSVFADC